MKKLHKMGGIAALYAGLAYVVGMIGFLGFVDVAGVADPVQKVALMAENEVFLSLLHLIVYQIWALFLVVLTLSLNDKFKSSAPAIMQVMTAIGLIWAGVVIAAGMIHNVGMGNVVVLYNSNPVQAATVWLAIDSVFVGIGGGNEILGGIWMLLVSWAAWHSEEMPKVLNYLGFVVGLAGVISALPYLGDVGMIFGLGQIIWFIWLGIILLKRNKEDLVG